jgi:hypothetical protein
MNSWISRDTSKFFLFGIVTFVLASSVWQSQAQIVTLVNNNSIAQVNTGSSAGMFYWSVDGQNQLAQQWFWYRIGNNAEAPINTISAPTITLPNAQTLYTTYGNVGYSVQVNYSLTGGLSGSGRSDIGESITINNYTAASLDFHFFQYSDFDLGGVTGGQTIQLGKNLGGFFNEAQQTGPGATLDESLTVAAPGAQHGEANFFNATLVKLNNGVPDNLNDNAGPLGPGDATWALQWDLLIAPGSSALISKDKYIQLSPIPEPSTLALISLGLAGIALRSRRPTA